MSKGKWWTPEELEALRRGEYPSSRPRCSCYVKRRQLGISSACKRWTLEEEEMLKRNVIPEGRSITQCRVHASVKKIPFCPKGQVRKFGRAPTLLKEQNAFKWQRYMMLNGLRDKLKSRIGGNNAHT